MAEHEADFIAFDDTAPTPGAGASSTTEAGSSSKAGKQRQPKAEASTLFVSSLPYNATSTDLVTHFSFIGPVRHGFVATDRETGKSKGVGYVTYAMREDAERALEELDGGAFGDKGRKIRVTWADRKVSTCFSLACEVCAALELCSGVQCSQVTSRSYGYWDRS